MDTEHKLCINCLKFKSPSKFRLVNHRRLKLCINCEHKINDYSNNKVCF